MKHMRRLTSSKHRKSYSDLRRTNPAGKTTESFGANTLVERFSTPRRWTSRFHSKSMLRDGVTYERRVASVYRAATGVMAGAVVM